MNRLPTLLPLTHIRVGLEITSKKRAFEEAGLLFEELHGLSRASVAEATAWPFHMVESRASRRQCWPLFYWPVQ